MSEFEGYEEVKEELEEEFEEEFDEEVDEEELRWHGHNECICPRPLRPPHRRLFKENERIKDTDLSIFTVAGYFDIEKCVDLDDKWCRYKKHKFYLEKFYPFQFVIVAKRDRC
ncbi:hypothetical protein [Vallitalea okinawensis]|uniref:hypothetical protein n=1 Tax=Vallitalea okinawensis TaxID=2078660 RepID=UPI000CFC8D40|nr:hypothetical protein [Vallitalea okinawensis]